MGLGLCLPFRTYCQFEEFSTEHPYLGARAGFSRNPRDKKKVQTLVDFLKSREVDVHIFHDFRNPPVFLASTSFFGLPYYLKNFSEEYRSFQESLKSRQGVNQSTKHHFSKIWYRNYILNYHNSLDSDVQILNLDSNFLKDKFVVFAGASPALESEILLLKKYRNKFFLLSSDTSAFFLIKNQIIPDAILSLDSGRGTIYHFRYEIPIDIPIITWFGANRELFIRKFKKYIFFTTYPLDQIIQSMHYPHSHVLHNPSLNIAGMAKSLCQALGVKKLLYAGTSFVSESGKTHCRGTGYESYILPILSRKKSLEGYRTGYRETTSKKNELAKREIFSGDFVDLLKEEYLTQEDELIHKPFSIQEKNILNHLFLIVGSSSRNLEILSNELNLPKTYLLKYLKAYT